MRWCGCLKAGWVLIVVITALAIGPGPAMADFTFGWPRMVPFLQPGDGGPCFPSDGLEMYIVRDESPGNGNRDLWVLKRASRDDDWGPAENLGPLVNGPGEDSLPSISSDGLMLYFYSDGHGGGRRLCDNTAHEGQSLGSASEAELQSVLRDTLGIFG